MTIELYHHGSSVCAAKVRLALAEKGVHVDRYHYVDILRGEQFAPAYLRIHPGAVVPALVHDDRVVIESTLICEYVDETFPGPALQPTDSYDRYRMRLWTKAVDELLHPACAELTYVSCHRHIINRLPPPEREAYFEKTPARTVKGAWRQRKRELVELGFDAPGVSDHVLVYGQHLDRMEATLAESRWLAGDQLTLADIALAPLINRLAMLSMAALWTDGRRPHVERWFEQLRSRPSFAPSLTDCCPRELADDLRRYGAISWPVVASLLR